MIPLLSNPQTTAQFTPDNNLHEGIIMLRGSICEHLDDLTGRDLKVLMKLCLHADRTTGHARVSRREIARWCSISDESNVTKSTTRLCELGLIEKTGDGAFSRACRYTVKMGIVSDLWVPKPRVSPLTPPGVTIDTRKEQASKNTQRETPPLPVVAQTQFPEPAPASVEPSPDSAPESTPAIAKTSSEPTSPIPEQLAHDDVVRQWAARTLPGLDLDPVFAKFRDYSLAHGKRYADWRAALRLWCRREKQWNTSAAQDPVRPSADESYAIVVGNRPGTKPNAIILHALAIARTQGRDQHWFRTQPERIGRATWQRVYVEALKATQQGEPMPGARSVRKGPVPIGELQTVLR